MTSHKFRKHFSPLPYQILNRFLYGGVGDLFCHLLIPVEGLGFVLSGAGAVHVAVGDEAHGVEVVGLGGLACEGEGFGFIRHAGVTVKEMLRKANLAIGMTEFSAFFVVVQGLFKVGVDAKAVFVGLGKNPQSKTVLCHCRFLSPIHGFTVICLQGGTVELSGLQKQGACKSKVLASWA